MSVCVGNYCIPTTDGIVEGADMLEGAGILNFLNIYVNRPPLILPIILLMVLDFVVEFPQLYINDSCSNCQFADLTYTGRCYCYHVLSHPERSTSKLP